MSNKALLSLGFIIGAATGSAVTWYLLKDKYEALAQEEIDSVKEVFLRREQELKILIKKNQILKSMRGGWKKKDTQDILISGPMRKKSLFLKPVRM